MILNYALVKEPKEDKREVPKDYFNIQMPEFLAKAIAMRKDDVVKHLLFNYVVYGYDKEISDKSSKNFLLAIKTQNPVIIDMLLSPKVAAPTIETLNAAIKLSEEKLQSVRPRSEAETNAKIINKRLLDFRDANYTYSYLFGYQSKQSSSGSQSNEPQNLKKKI